MTRPGQSGDKMARGLNIHFYKKEILVVVVVVVVFLQKPIGREGVGGGPAMFPNTLAEKLRVYFPFPYAGKHVPS